MSDRNNRDINQDYLDLLDEYARREREEKSKTEKIDVNFYNDETEISSIGFGNLNTSEDLSLFDDQKPIKNNVSATPMVKKREPKEKNPFKRFAKWFKNLPTFKKVIFSIIAIILAIIIVLFSVGGIFVTQKLSLLGDAIDNNEEEIIYEDEEYEDIEIDIGSAGFKQSLIDWATIGNDKKMSNKDVINVLLIGADSRNGTNTGNTDVMMLISVNKQTKELKLVSFFRDSYLYVEGERGSYCTKLNAAFSMGGPETLVKTIENNYKIEIDNYVMVNFESFKTIVDAMGGVTVDVQQYEADYNYKKFGVALPVGEDVTLNGEQALCFVRIRNCDSDGDVSRTRRQRQVIDSILSRVKKASISDLNKYIDLLLPYVDTGYKKTEIVSMGIKALTGGWANFERKQLQMPPENCRTSGSANMWIWVVDYELAAHELQMELYGQSNINLTDDRVSIIDVYRGVNYSGTKTTFDNNNTGSVVITTTTKPVITTEPQTTKVEVTENKKPTEVITTEVIDTTEVIQEEEEITEPPTTEEITTEEETTLPPETEPVTTPPETEVLEE